MTPSRFWIATEFACKTARSLFVGKGAPTLPGPLDDGDLLARGYEELAADPEYQAMEQVRRERRDRNRLREAEEENEVLDESVPWWVERAVEGKAAKTEPTIERFGLKLTPSSFDRLGESLDRITAAERDAFRSGGQTYETGPRPTLSVPTPEFTKVCCGDGPDGYCRNCPESPAAGAAAGPVAPEEARPEPASSGVLEAICDVLAEHHPFEGVRAGSVCCAMSGMTGDHEQVFDTREAWREHVAPLIAAALDGAL